MRKTIGRTLLTKNTGTEGALGELLVVVDLMRRGFQVFRAMSPACDYDLIVIKADEKPLKFEVTKGQQDKGKLRWPKHKNPYDIIAVWEADSSISYFNQRGERAGFGFELPNDFKTKKAEPLKLQ